MTRALKNLTNLKNTASTAISLLTNTDTVECYENTFLKILTKIIVQTAEMAFAIFSKCQILKSSCKNSMLVQYAVQIFFDATAKDNFLLNVKLLLKETKKRSLKSRCHGQGELN